LPSEPAEPPPAAEKPAEKPARKPVKKKEPKVDLDARKVERALLKSSPHKIGPDSVPKIMFTVIIALLPACAAACWFFGIKALLVIVGCTVGCVALEFATLCLKKSPAEAWRRSIDGSAIITGILLGLNLPSNAAWWLVLIGCVVAIVIGKQTFGGLGQNPFNPALVARVFLLLSFPAHMTSWEIPVDRFLQLDGVTSATPLGVLATDGVGALSEQGINWLQLTLGNTGGSLGEISVIALLIGAAYMMIRRVITWHIPVSFIGVVALFTGIMWLVDSDTYANPVFHLVSGGLVLGAFFMATDMVTSPVTARGMLIFGAGCGLLTAAIRMFGSFPEGVSFAILVMNAMVPLIERRTRPLKFGETRATRKEAKANG
jgi:Na+-translocating ferredoxin:NAD+ oxidoreductase subunit D